MTSSSSETRASPLKTGLILFVMAGDPTLDDLPEVLRACDRNDVDFVEVAVPFPDSPTDGVVIRAAADRALGRGVTLDAVLAVIGRVRPTLRHTRIVVLADWAWSIRSIGLTDAIDRIAASGSDGVLFHALPPVLAQDARRLTTNRGLGTVATCYLTHSSPSKLISTAGAATSYVYLVSAYGRSGGHLNVDEDHLKRAVATLTENTDVPVAVGFGVRHRSDVEQILSLGADAAVVGSAAVAAMDLAGPGAAAVGIAHLITEVRPRQHPAREVPETHMQLPANLQ